MASFVPPPGCVAVIFTAQRSSVDETGYADAALAMEQLAATQPGYLGFRAVRGTDGVGIATSFWESDAAARAWRDNPAHSAVRERGRAHWYLWTEIVVARVERSYCWQSGSV